MLLAIDAGNTNIVFALCEDGQIRARWRIATDRRRTADQYSVWLYQLLTLVGLDRGSVSRAILASVVPAVNFELTLLCRNFFGAEPRIVGQPGLDLGIRVDLPNPSEVGADRLVNALAAHRLVPDRPLIVVDFGTATTFDVVGVDGAYQGGVICPGIALSLDALFQAAARLPRIAAEAPLPGEPVIGKGTVHAMRSGVFWGYIGLIEGLVARISSEIGEVPRVIATGGLAPMFMGYTSAIHEAEPDLTILGLIAIDELNRS